jgi:hypothetical protein
VGGVSSCKESTNGRVCDATSVCQWCSAGGSRGVGVRVTREFLESGLDDGTDSLIVKGDGASDN